MGKFILECVCCSVKEKDPGDNKFTIAEITKTIEETNKKAALLFVPELGFVNDNVRNGIENCLMNRGLREIEEEPVLFDSDSEVSDKNCLDSAENNDCSNVENDKSHGALLDQSCSRVQGEKNENESFSTKIHKPLVRGTPVRNSYKIRIKKNGSIASVCDSNDGHTNSTRQNARLNDTGYSSPRGESRDSLLDSSSSRNHDNSTVKDISKLANKHNLPPILIQNKKTGAQISLDQAILDELISESDAEKLRAHARMHQSNMALSKLTASNVSKHC